MTDLPKGEFQSFQARTTAKFDQIDKALDNQAVATAFLALAVMFVCGAIVVRIAVEVGSNAHS